MAPFYHLHEVFPYLRLEISAIAQELVASTRRFHSYHTFCGHLPGLCNCPVSSWPFATGGISVRYRLQLRASTRRFHSSQNHITFFFTGTTQDCATALLVVGPSPQGVSQLRYRLQLRTSARRFTQNHITLFTGTTQDCATALLVVGPSPQGVSQLTSVPLAR